MVEGAAVSCYVLGASAEFAVVTAEGYRVKEMTVNGKVVYPNADGTFVIEYVTEDITFTVVSEVIPVIDDTVPGGGSATEGGCKSTVSSMGTVLALCILAIFKNKLNKKKD